MGAFTKMKKIIYILIIFILTCFNAKYVGFGFDENEHEIEIYVSSDLNIGALPVGTIKTFDFEEQIIKFVIKCKKNRLIKITKLGEAGNDNIIIDAEWKVGPNTGFELPFDRNGIYRTEQDLFVVTVKLKSVEVKRYVQSGSYRISPQITVEYADL